MSKNIFFTFLVNMSIVSSQNFTIVQIPDTQKYTESYPSIFYRQMEWIIEKRDSLNIVFVAHVGDLVEHESSVLEHEVADSAFSILESYISEQHINGIPYSVVPGNHDYPTTLYNEYFSANRFSDSNYYGGCLSCPNNENNYTFFSIGELEFMIISIDTHPHSNETIDEKVQWADSLMNVYPLKKVVIVGHYFLDYGLENSIYMNFSESGEYIFNNLKHNNNLALILTGHVWGEGIKTVIVEDRVIHTILANYQGRANGGNGWLRLLKFFPENNTIEITTYSPSLNSFENDEDSKLSLFFEMGGIGSPPKISLIDDKSFFEDETLHFPISVSDEEEDSLSYFVTISDTNLSISVKDEFISIIPKENWHGNATALLGVSDGRFTTHSEFNLSINSVNDGPEIDFRDIEMYMNTEISIPLPRMDVDGDILEYSIFLPEPNIFQSIINDSILFIQPMTNWFGSSDALLNVSDGRISSFFEFKITVFDSLLYLQSNEYNYYPQEIFINQNYPNPFNVFTSFEYGITTNQFVTITIHDLLGRKIKTLVNSFQMAGNKTIQWNGTNDRDELVSAGLYLCLINVGNYSSAMKMLMLK